MRTTLALDDDVLVVIHDYAERRQISLGKAASDLVRRGARFQLGTRTVNGLPVFDAPSEFPVISTELVRELSSEE